MSTREQHLSDLIEITYKLRADIDLNNPTSSSYQTTTIRTAGTYFTSAMPSIRTLIISDTHDTWPYSLSDPAPSVDVFIHCGDLTQYGGLPSFTRAMAAIAQVDAELKLVIAGNHDVDLDPIWVAQFTEDQDDVADGAKCREVMSAQQARGVYYLEEGTHEFVLRDGRRFTIYATPYTPRFGDFAFGYGGEEDRFNYGPGQIPVGVDIVISHGPPALPGFAGYTLDISRRGEHCGCDKLGKALKRVRPKVCCFGHIHEGRGVAEVNWCEGALNKVMGDAESVVRFHEEGDRTLLVNAAVLGDRTGWLVDIGL